MNEKFNKNAKVEQLTKVVLSHGEEKGLIVKDPLQIIVKLTNKFVYLLSWVEIKSLLFHIFWFTKWPVM